MVEEVLDSSEEGEKEEDSPKVKLAKEIGKEMFCDEVEAKLSRLEAMGPMAELEQYEMTRWLKNAHNDYSF